MYVILTIIVIAGLVHLSKSLFKRDLYGKEVPVLLRYLGAWRVNGGNSGQSIEFRVGKVEWYWAPRLGLRFEISPSYEENYFNIHTCFFWGVLCIALPVRPKSWDPNMDINEAEQYRYGFGVNSDFFFITKGGVNGYWCTWPIPFIYRHFVKRYDFGEKYTKIKTDYDGTAITATYWEEHMLHRPKWWPFKILTRRLNYDFNGLEVGPRKGSWKGGTMSGSRWIPDDADLHEAFEKSFAEMSRK